MSEYDQAFDPNILTGHCDLISRFSDFGLYLDTQLVYFHNYTPGIRSIRGYIVFAFSVCLSVCKLFFCVKVFSGTT